MAAVLGAVLEERCAGAASVWNERGRSTSVACSSKF
jgi:hypothetical protein